MDRKTLFAVAGIAAFGGLLVAQDAPRPRPVNKICPVMAGRKVDTTQTLVYKGKVIGLCCSECIDKWKKNPAGFAGTVKEDADEGPDGLENLKEALGGAKAGPYPLVLFFGDASPRTKAFLKLLSDPDIGDLLSQCSFVRVDPKRDAAEMKPFKPKGVPSLLIYDPTTDPPALFKSVAPGAPKAVIKDLEEGIRKVRGE
jgi:hypothetical protein